jgi:glycosyltransferase involved in cell wall biosynthesis
MDKIKVVFYGPIFFRIAKLLQDNTKLEISLVITQTDYELLTDEVDDLDSKVKLFIINYRIFKNIKANRLEKQLKFNSDLTIYSEDSLIFCFTPKSEKNIFLPIGYDLTRLPIFYYDEFKTKSLVGKAKKIVIGIIQRQRIKKMDQIWCSDFPPFNRALNTLGIVNRISNRFFPLPIDFKNHQEIDFDQDKCCDELGLRKESFKIFYPNRLMISEKSSDILTGQTKGTDIFLKGFAQYIKSRPDKNIEVIFIKNKGSVSESEVVDLITLLKIEKYIKWVKPKFENPRLGNSELSRIYRISDVVIGDLSSKWFGQTTIEAAFYEKPIIANMEIEYMKINFGFNPFCQASDINDIALELENLIEDKNYSYNKAKEMGDWYNKNFTENQIREFYYKLILENYSKGA